MLGANEVIALEEIQKRLETRIIGHSDRANELWEEIGSTSTRVAELASEGVDEGVFVVARQQTAGRGRLGRAWPVAPRRGNLCKRVAAPRNHECSRSSPNHFGLWCGCR